MNEAKKKSSILSFAVVAISLFAGVSIQPSDAEAASIRNHASACMRLGGDPIDLTFSIQNDSPTATAQFLCSFEERTFFKGDVVTLEVYAYDGTGTGGVSAMACESETTVAGGRCGTMTTSSTVNVVDVTLNPATTIWANDTDLGYLWVQLPAESSTGVRSAFKGYFAED